MFTVEKSNYSPINGEVNVSKYFVTVTDRAIDRSNKIAKNYGYLPYELTRKLEDFSEKYKKIIKSPIHKKYHITDIGNISIKKSSHYNVSHGEYFVKGIYDVIRYFENEGFLIEIKLDFDYTWSLYKNGIMLKSKRGNWLDNYYDVICDMLNSYMDNYEEYFGRN